MADPYAVAAELIELMSRETWRWLGPALAQCLDGVDASAGPVLDLGAGPTEPVAIPPTGLVTYTVSHRRYTGSGQAQPDGPESVQWQMTYRTFEGDELVAEVEARYRWWTIAPARLLTETAAAGLAAERHYPDLFIIRQAAA